MHAAQKSSQKRGVKHKKKNQDINPQEDYQIEGYEDIKRGIHLQDRSSKEAKETSAEKFISLLEGGKFGLWGVGFLLIISIINLFLVLPVLSLNLSPSYNSAALTMAADFVSSGGFITNEQFFLGLTVFAFLVVPISIYLFVRKNVFKNDLAAFLAALFFILPTPFLKSGMPLIGTLLSGDGGHAFAFAFIPLVLLAMQHYISTGIFSYGVLSAMGAAAIAVISPFAFFNLLIIFTILSIAEGFVGGFRMKLGRAPFVVLSSLALAFFWYYPNLMAQILTIDHVVLTFKKSLAVLPLAIPALPIAGTISFIVFDRREKLRPVFVGIALLLSYWALFSFSKNINLSGIFTSSRYEVELSFAGAFFIAFIVAALNQYFLKKYVLLKTSRLMSALYFLVATCFVAFLGFASYMSIDTVRMTIANQVVSQQYHIGIGSFARVFTPGDSSTLLASSLSLFTLLLLGVMLIKFSLSSKPKEAVSSTS